MGRSVVVCPPGSPFGDSNRCEEFELIPDAYVFDWGASDARSDNTRLGIPFSSLEATSILNEGMPNGNHLPVGILNTSKWRVCRMLLQIMGCSTYSHCLNFKLLVTRIRGHDNRYIGAAWGVVLWLFSHTSSWFLEGLLLWVFVAQSRVLRPLAVLMGGWRLSVQLMSQKYQAYECYSTWSAAFWYCSWMWAIARSCFSCAGTQTLIHAIARWCSVDRLACRFVSGWYPDVVRCLILKSFQRSLNNLLTTCAQLSARNKAVFLYGMSQWS